jgi:hypothetical protein
LFSLLHDADGFIRLHPADSMGLSGAGHLDPLLYPWDSPVASGVMDGNEFRPLELSTGLDEALAQAGAAPLETRSLVVSVGSNSSADVMRRKFANYHQPVSAVLPLVRGQLHNIAVGHSAHVSQAGYIAAARTRCWESAQRSGFRGWTMSS